MTSKPQKRNILKIALLIIFIVIIILIGGFYIYTLDYYRADDFAIQTMTGETTRISTENYAQHSKMLIIQKNAE
jgi:hypothetical protein